MKNKKLPPLFIPSYKRSENLKTLKYFIKMEYPPKLIYIIIDSEADDIEDYEKVCKEYGCNLRIFDMDEARRRYDYVHRPSVSRRSAGQARNMFYDIAKKEGISFYVVQDDDTNDMQVRPGCVYKRMATSEDIKSTFIAVREFMERKKIGCFGLSQTGDMFQYSCKLIRQKVMNTTFINTKFIYRGERGVQDDDTSQFVTIMNEGLFTGSANGGLVLNQTASAKAKGGLTELYNECKLLNKALLSVIQYPSCIIAEKQKMNGGRLHHRISNKFLYPRLIKGRKEQDNIAWDTYPEDVIFTLEPKRKQD